MENPTCIARLVQFKVVAVARQPRFYHIQHLNEVTVVGKRSLRAAQSVKDERVYAMVAKSLPSYITFVPNFWNVIYAKLFVK